MKKCNVCQSIMDDNSKFCVSCGNDFNNNQMGQYVQPMMNNQMGQYSQPMMSNMPPKPKSSMPKILICCSVFIVLAAVIVFIVVTLFNKGGRGASSIDEAAKAYVNSMADGDYEANLDVTIFECDDNTYNKAMNNADVYGEYSDFFENLEVGNIKITNKEKYSKEDISSIEDDIRYYNDLEVNIRECYDVTVSYEYTYMGNTEEMEYELIIAKVDGKWYVLNYYIY